MLEMNNMAPWVPSFNQAIEGELAASDNNPPFICFQLSTIDSKTGFPQNRTVIHRGWLFDDKSSNVLTFTTDKRMAKYHQLVENDRFEAVFWFPHINKQFRFRGHARIIDDQYHPIIGTIERKPYLQTATPANESDDELDFNYGRLNDRVSSLRSASSNSSVNLSANIAGANFHSEKPLPPQKSPIVASVCSPSLVSKLNSSSGEFSYSNLSNLQFQPPTEQEWQNEIQRQWQKLSKKLKKSFRKPTPGSVMTDESRKKIDSISRGVDGKKDEDGVKNFAVVAMFIEHVDLYESDKDRRYVYEKDSYQQWMEQEVCP